MNSPEAAPQRILITRLSAHGDVVQTLPLLAALKAAWPQCQVGWLVETPAAPLLENHPLIDRLHVCRRKQWLRELKNPCRWPGIAREIRQFLAGLRKPRYEASLDVQGLLKSALWPWLAGIPRRWGNARAREGASLFYTHRLPPHRIEDAQTPAVSRYLEFAQALGGPAETTTRPVFVLAPPPAESDARVDAWLSGLPEHRPVVVLSPGTVWPSKRWPARHWDKLFQKLVGCPLNVILLGTEAEKSVFAPILPHPLPVHVLDLMGKTTLGDLAALLSRVDVLIGPDSAPLHLANATNRAHLIALFGPTSPGRTGPVETDPARAPHQTLTTHLPCQPCFARHCPIQTHECLETLSPETVFEALKTHLAETLCE